MFSKLVDFFKQVNSNLKNDNSQNHEKNKNNENPYYNKFNINNNIDPYFIANSSKIKFFNFLVEEIKIKNKINHQDSNYSSYSDTISNEINLNHNNINIINNNIIQNVEPKINMKNYIRNNSILSNVRELENLINLSSKLLFFFLFKT